MKAVLILFGGHLAKEAFEPILDGKNSVDICLQQAKKIPNVDKIVLFAPQGGFSFLNDVHIEQFNQNGGANPWTKRFLLEKIAEFSDGYGLVYFAFADCPFLDPVLAQRIAQRHIEQRAEYSYADGWPFGLAPELLSGGTAAILSKIIANDASAEDPVERNFLFSVISKDINAFDIEAEISTVDLRCHRLNICADSKRNLLLIKNFIAAAENKIPSAEDIENIIQNRPQVLRTLPAFYPIQVFGGCSQQCSICPYPAFMEPASEKKFMSAENYEALLDKIAAFSGDAVVDLSLWGELSLHPEKLKLIEAILSRNSLSLVIETSGIGWKTEELEEIFNLENSLVKKENLRPIPALSWIVSLDAADSGHYAQLRGNGFLEAQECAKKLLSLFPDNCYVQAVRLKGMEEETEKFYRYWKDASPRGEKNIIIQKYDDFCGKLEKKQASDISPLIRKPCWHIMRDMPILLDGSVPLCREDLGVLKDKNKGIILGNVFTDSLESIWQKGEKHYIEQCEKKYTGLCENCDEYYTYNF